MKEKQLFNKADLKHILTELEFAATVRHNEFIETKSLRAANKERLSRLIINKIERYGKQQQERTDRHRD